jgi:hypothetical protein
MKVPRFFMVDESSKILHYLKDQNANQRQQIKCLKKGGMKELTIHNQNLQEANRMAAEAQARMECHIEGPQASNAQLTDNIEIFKGVHCDHETRIPTATRILPM